MSDRPEPSFRSKLGRALRDVAPTLAGAFGGPLAGAATETVSRAIFGDSHGDEAALETAVLAGAPETLAALRQAEVEFRKAVLSVVIEEQKLANEDRANARARQIAVRDITPTLLGLSVIAGFFFVLAVMLWRELPAQAETEFSIMLGALATMTAAVVNYFFGSSVGSREKTKIMAIKRD